MVERNTIFKIDGLDGDWLEATFYNDGLQISVDNPRAGEGSRLGRRTNVRLNMVAARRFSEWLARAALAKASP